MDAGRPSGRGVAVGGVYYLPVRAEVPSGKPAVCALDLVTGRVISRMPWPRKEAAGNLLFVKNRVLPQTLTGLTCHAQAELGGDGAAPRKQP